MVGEAGLGKSRLVAEARAVAGKSGVGWLEGRTLSFGRTISYWPLLEIIQEDSGIASDDSEAERWAKLAGRVGGLFGHEGAEVLPYLATLLTLPIPEDLAHKVRHLDGEAMGRQVYRATRLFFARLAAERPTVVVVEDVHWLDGSSASLLEHLLPLTREAPLLFCLISRPQTEADTALARLQELAREQYADRVTEIALRPLSPEESTLLVRNLVQLDDLPSRLHDTILDRAEGNPFFVEEVVRGLIDLGGLVREESTGRWRVTDQATRISIPDTLQGVIMARVDRLDEDLKQVLRLASVIGRSFFYRVLDSIAEAERDLDRSLADLEARELVQEKARDPELEYMFKHALVQEATYESILLQRRKELHRRVAATIEVLFADRLEEFYSLLAYHYSKAEDWERAQEYLFKAGDQAGSIAADAEALAHYEEAVEAYTRAFGDQWDPFQRAALERKMGEALYRTGEHERARDYLCRALATLGSPFPTSNGAVRRAIMVELLRQVGHRLLWRFPRRSPSSDEARIAEERLWLYNSLGWIDAGHPVRMLLDTLIPLNLAERYGLDWAVGGWTAVLGYVCDFVPLPRLSRFYHRRCLVVAEQAPEQGLWETQFALATAHFFVGIHEYVATGNWVSSRDHERQARGELFRLGRIRDWAAATSQLGTVLFDQGELTEPLALSREMITLGEETGDHVVEAWGRLYAGAMLLNVQGQFEEAEKHLLAAATALFAALDVVMGVGARAHIASSRLKQGKLDEARALLSEEIDRVRKNDVRGIYVATSGLPTPPSAWRPRNRHKAPRGRLHSTRRRPPAALSSSTASSTSAPWLPATGCRGPTSGSAAIRARPGSGGGRASTWPRSSGSRLHGAQTYLEIGRRTGDLAALQRAEAEFAEMGAAYDLAEARRLLAAHRDRGALGPTSGRAGVSHGSKGGTR